MSYLMIVVGIILVAAGIFTLSCNNGNDKKSEEISVKSEELASTSKQSSEKDIDEEKTPLEKGHEFEDYIVRLLQNNKHMKILNRSSDRLVDGKTDEDSKNPDILAELQLDNGNKYRFAVECKWRGTKSKVINWAKEWQLERYKKYAKENGIEVYIAIGLEGEPGNPKELYIAPLDKLKNHECKYDELKQYKNNISASDSYLFYKAKEHELFVASETKKEEATTLTKDKH